jgi:hypothetical protein
MPINRIILATTLTLSAIGQSARAEPPLPAEDASRAPIEFRLVHPAPHTPEDTDVFEEGDPAAIQRLQAEMAAMPRLANPHDPRQSFTSVLASGLTLLPVIGQFANHDWVKGLLVLGTGAGLGVGIYLGQRDGNPQLIRLGTLGLYPLAAFSVLDAYATSRHRAEEAAHAASGPAGPLRQTPQRRNVNRSEVQRIR